MDRATGAFAARNIKMKMRIGISQIIALITIAMLIIKNEEARLIYMAAVPILAMVMLFEIECSRKRGGVPLYLERFSNRYGNSSALILGYSVAVIAAIWWLLAAFGLVGI